MIVRPSIVGRYALYGEIASGGMATVHYGRLLGEAGFTRTVAVKRLHAHLAKDPEFATMFLDEARLAARVQHPNVVTTLDVVQQEGELYLVLEYVHGESLSRLSSVVRKRGETIPVHFATSIATQVLLGLHAAHEATDEHGEPLGLVHRDVSPQNVMIGQDGVTRVLDFGVAKAAGRVQTTREGQIKGKIAYMAPEQARAGTTDRRTDVFGASIILWELLAGQRLFSGSNEAMVLAQLLDGVPRPPSALRPDLPRALDEIVMRGLAQNPDARFQTAREMAIAIEEAAPMASARMIGDWVSKIAEAQLTSRAERVREIEKSTKDLDAGRASLPGASPVAHEAPIVVEATPVSRPARPNITIPHDDDDEALTAAMEFPAGMRRDDDPKTLEARTIEVKTIDASAPMPSPTVGAPSSLASAPIVVSALADVTRAPNASSPSAPSTNMSSSSAVALPDVASSSPLEVAPSSEAPVATDPSVESTSQVSQVSTVGVAGTRPPPAPSNGIGSRRSRGVALAIVGGAVIAIGVLALAKSSHTPAAAPPRGAVVVEVQAPAPPVDTPAPTIAPKAIESAMANEAPSSSATASAPTPAIADKPRTPAAAVDAPSKATASPPSTATAKAKVRPPPIKFTDPG